MDLGIQSIFGSENPYKFLFLSGVILFVFGLYYPFEKRQDLDIKRNNVELKDSTLVLEIMELKNNIESLKTESKDMLLRIDSLNRLELSVHDRNNIDYKINEIKIEFDKKYKEQIINKYSIEKKVIESEFMNRELVIYDNHLREIKIYSLIFIVSGLSFIVYGGLKWLFYFRKKFED